MGEDGARRALGDAQAALAVPADGSLGPQAVVDDVHAADLARVIDKEVVMFDVALALFDIEVRGAVRIVGIHGGRDHFQRAARVFRRTDAVARDGIPAVRELIGGEVVQNALRADGTARCGNGRAQEIDAAVGIRLQRVLVAADGAPVPLGGVGIELRHIVVDADAVEDDLAEVGVGRFALMLPVEIFLIPGVFVRALGLVRAHAVDLIVLVRLRVGAVHPVRDVHRVIDVGIGEILAVEGVGRDALGERDALLRRRVVGDDIVALLVHDVHRPVRFDKAVERGVVGNAEEQALVRAVETRGAEVEIGVVHLTRRIARVVGRRVIDAVAVDIQPRGVVRRDHERGDDGLGRVDARLDVGHLRPHQRALDGRAVGIVRGVRLDAVDEVDVIALLYDEAALRDDLRVRRGSAVEGLERIAAARHRRRGCRKQRAGGSNAEFSENFTHENYPSNLRVPPF